MSFIWPAVLLLLLAIPLGSALYLRRERRRRQRIAEALGTLRPVARPGDGGRGWGLRRRVPGALIVAGLVVLVVAMARPQSVIGVPRFEGTVILAFDVSGSMAATDMDPTRMEAAKTAAQIALDKAQTADSAACTATGQSVVCRFDEEGRCREFTEYYMRRRSEPSVEDAVVD